MLALCITTLHYVLLATDEGRNSGLWTLLRELPTRWTSQHNADECLTAAGDGAGAGRRECYSCVSNGDGGVEHNCSFARHEEQ